LSISATSRVAEDCNRRENTAAFLSPFQQTPPAASPQFFASFGKKFSNAASSFVSKPPASPVPQSQRKPPPRRFGKSKLHSTGALFAAAGLFYRHAENVDLPSQTATPHATSRRHFISCYN
jgi:hypothetical protein